MNKNNAHEFLGLVKALSEGKTIEYKHLGEWRSSTDFDFSGARENYRIAFPIPKIAVKCESDQDKVEIAGFLSVLLNKPLDTFFYRKAHRFW